jgi:hypothetical protein
MRPVPLFALALATAGCFGGSASTAPQTAPTGRLVASFVTQGGVQFGPDINPVKDAPILVTGTASDGKHVERRLTTDQEGRFTLQLPPGKYKIENGVYTYVTGSVVVAAGETAHARLVVYVQ